jgi:hypothetical protein
MHLTAHTHKHAQDGHGYLYFPNGDMHECDFTEGRCHGPGVLLSANGSEMRGNWEMNKRVGDYAIVDGEGVHWMERYDKDGKRTVRRKVRESVPNPAFTPGAKTGMSHLQNATMITSY